MRCHLQRAPTHACEDCGEVKEDCYDYETVFEDQDRKIVFTLCIKCILKYVQGLVGRRIVTMREPS